MSHILSTAAYASTPEVEEPRREGHGLLCAHPETYRCRVKMAYVILSRPASGLGFQVKALSAFKWLHPRWEGNPHPDQPLADVRGEEGRGDQDYREKGGQGRGDPEGAAPPSLSLARTHAHVLTCAHLPRVSSKRFLLPSLFPLTSPSCSLAPTQIYTHPEGKRWRERERERTCPLRAPPLPYLSPCTRRQAEAIPLNPSTPHALPCPPVVNTVWSSRCRENMAHANQFWPEFGLDLTVKVLKAF